MTPASRVALAHPSKAFFVDMLTRDIAVTDCILDLIDNAVDKAVRRSGLDVMTILTMGEPNVPVTDARIEIAFSPAEFRISDTCGGISIEEAMEHVFLLGNPENEPAPQGLSVYGIGMKRAFFKLGNQVRVESHTKTERWTVPIDVLEWVSDSENWTFPLQDARARTPGDRLGPPGTVINVTDLNGGVSQRFSQPSFESELRRRISATYVLFITSGIVISVNGQPVTASVPRLAAETLQPARRGYRSGNVDVLILAGVAPKDDKAAHGVYVLCNGRMVVEADKSELTGWGDVLPQWHVKYRRFVAIVYFESEDVLALPWRTTKQGVAPESAVYQQALIELRAYARPVTTFLNRLYPSEITEDVAVRREVIDQAKSVAISTIRGSDVAFSVKAAKKPKLLTVSIQYRRPIAILDRIRAHLDNRGMSARHIGEYTFDYFVEQELG